MSHAWAILLSVALGFVAVYLLLPRPRSYSPWWGALLTVFALLVGGSLLLGGGAPVETVLFYVFSAIAVLAGVLLITQRNPVRAALSFALVVLSTCGLFLLQAAPFLMAATIIIYAGAIIVTFLFVIMLAQQAGLSDADARSREPLLSCVAGFLLLGSILLVLQVTYNTSDLDALLRRTEQATQEPSAAAMQQILGDKRDFLDRFDGVAKKLPVSSELAGPLRAALDDLESEWKERGGDAEKMKLALVRLLDSGVQVRNRQGSLQPPTQLPMSPYSQHHRGLEGLPKDNVAHLGRALFTDYLLAVELGGTLLLVATIGAIAITARRGEGPR